MDKETPDFNEWILSEDPDKYKEMNSVSVELYPHEITALAISVADQLAIFRGAILSGDLHDDHISQANIMYKLHRDLMVKLDVDNEGLLDAWDESIELMKMQFDIEEQENNVIELNDIRKEKEKNEQFNEENNEYGYYLLRVER